MKIAILSGNQEEIAMQLTDLGISFEEILLLNYSDSSALLRKLEQEEPKLIVIDGCLGAERIDSLLETIQKKTDSQRVRLTVGILSQEKYKTKNAIWFQNIQNIGEHWTRFWKPGVS